jgi:hypothetical protein
MASWDGTNIHVDVMHEKGIYKSIIYVPLCL